MLNFKFFKKIELLFFIKSFNLFLDKQVVALFKNTIDF